MQYLGLIKSLCNIYMCTIQVQFLKLQDSKQSNEILLCPFAMYSWFSICVFFRVMQ